MTQMIIKLHKNDAKIVAAVCDSELLGKKFEEGTRQLDMTSDFFRGEDKPDIEVGDMVRNSDCVNLVGKNAIRLGLDEGVIEQGQVKTIAGIPYAQAEVIKE